MSMLWRFAKMYVVYFVVLVSCLFLLQWWVDDNMSNGDNDITVPLITGALLIAFLVNYISEKWKL